MADSTPTRLRFRRSDRIKQGRDFTRLRLHGARLTSGCLIVNWLKLTESARSRLGVITSRRIGGAVVRNKARRLMRESFRLHQQELACPVDLILVARQSIAGKALSDVEKDLLTSLRKAGLLKGFIGK
jgi:ribonuclease P protein component